MKIQLQNKSNEKVDDIRNTRLHVHVVVAIQGEQLLISHAGLNFAALCAFSIYSGNIKHVKSLL